MLFAKVQRTVFLSFLGMAAGVSLCLTASRAMPSSQSKPRSATITPFVLRMVIYDVGSKAPKAPVSRLFGRRGDGATVEITSAGPAELGHTAKLISFPNGDSVRVSDEMRVKATQNANPKLARDPAAASPQRCTGSASAFLREETMLDQTVFVVDEVPKDMAPRGLRLTSWHAPALGCTPLKYEVASKQPDGSWKTVTDAQPVSLTLTEPDPSLFQVPQDYEDITPPEAGAEVPGGPEEGTSQSLAWALKFTAGRACRRGQNAQRFCGNSARLRALFPFRSDRAVSGLHLATATIKRTTTARKKRVNRMPFNRFVGSCSLCIVYYLVYT